MGIAGLDLLLLEPVNNVAGCDWFLLHHAGPTDHVEGMEPTESYVLVLPTMLDSRREEPPIIGCYVGGYCEPYRWVGVGK